MAKIPEEVIKYIQETAENIKYGEITIIVRERSNIVDVKVQNVKRFEK